MSHSCYIIIHLFFFNDTATTEIYTLSLHDALPIYEKSYAKAEKLLAAGCVFSDFGTRRRASKQAEDIVVRAMRDCDRAGDRKSTRLNSSHANISYAVFCLKKKIK